MKKLRISDAEKVKILRLALNQLLAHSISNRGTKDAFITCCTYGWLNGKLPEPYNYAEKVLEKTK